jgi:hypothetical protein
MRAGIAAAVALGAAFRRRVRPVQGAGGEREEFARAGDDEAHGQAPAALRVLHQDAGAEGFGVSALDD